MRDMAWKYLAILFAAATLAAGCGGDDGGNVATTDKDLIEKNCSVPDDCPQPLECLHDAKSGRSFCAATCWGPHVCDQGCCADTDGGSYCVPDDLCEEEAESQSTE